ncbi:MAG: hypothetical protein HQ519_02430 [Planctomycetes bacterium]|nr:hypothetical protein [Planctomycetota bacterium]
MTGSKKARAALQDYLKTAQPVRPTLIVSAPDPTVALPADHGYLTPSFDRGALIFKNTAGEIFRLSWLEDETKDAAQDEEKPTDIDGAEIDPTLDRRRSLPVGEYTLVGYRLCRNDENGERWDLSASGPKLLKVKVKAGVDQQIKIDQTIRFNHKLTSKSINLGIGGDLGSALAIYKAGKRIPVDFDLQDAQGKSRYKGRIRYA